MSHRITGNLIEWLADGAQTERGYETICHERGIAKLGHRHLVVDFALRLHFRARSGRGLSAEVGECEV